jgi:AcrR family transcriptional regulator
LWFEFVSSLSPAPDFCLSKPNRFDEISAIANELFLSQGYDATSINDIRRACGFRSKASLYSYFKSKEDIAEFMVRKAAHELKDFICQEIQLLKTTEPLEQFGIVGRAYVRWALEHPQQYCFRFLRSQQKRLFTGSYDCRDDILAALYDQTLVLIGHLRHEHPVRNLPDETLFTLMLGLVGRAVIDRNEFGDIDISEKVDLIFNMLLAVLIDSQAVLAK